METKAPTQAAKTEPKKPATTAAAAAAAPEAEETDHGLDDITAISRCVRLVDRVPPADRMRVVNFLAEKYISQWRQSQPSSALGRPFPPPAPPPHAPAATNGAAAPHA